MEPLVLRPDEAAAVLRVSRTKVYEMAAAGILPCVRLGSSIRIPARALREWVEAQTTHGGTVGSALVANPEPATGGSALRS